MQHGRSASPVSPCWPPQRLQQRRALGQALRAAVLRRRRSCRTSATRSPAPTSTTCSRPARARAAPPAATAAAAAATEAISTMLPRRISRVRSPGSALALLARAARRAAVLPEDRADVLYHRYDGGGVTIDGPVGAAAQEVRREVLGLGQLLRRHGVERLDRRDDDRQPVHRGAHAGQPRLDLLQGKTHTASATR